MFAEILAFVESRIIVPDPDVAVIFGLPTDHPPMLAELVVNKPVVASIFVTPDVVVLLKVPVPLVVHR